MSSNLPLGFTAALIAGGKSSRMGRDKRLIEVGGQPLWRRQIEIFRLLQPAELVISGPLDGPWAGSGYKIIPDRESECGPLAGISAVLDSAHSPLVLVLAVDMPQMSATYLRSLLDKCTATCGIVPSQGESFEPLAAVYPRNCIAIAEEQLHSGNYSLQHFVRSCLDARLLAEFKIPTADEDLFYNFNHPEDIPASATDPV